MVLFHSKPVLATDDAGITVLKSVHPPPYIPGPYASAPVPIVHGVPLLSWICIQKLYPYPDQVDLTNLQIRLNYRSYLQPDSILIPDYPNIDPRLWATLVQLYDALPDKLESFPIPLDDVHLPLLQRIRSTPLFSLVTVLELPACPDLTDDTIVHLKFLHTLSAFDASATRITAYAIHSLAGTLQVNGDAKPKDTRHRGPWTLRILRLRHCKAVTNDVFPHLLKFPLLSVIDLRGSGCSPQRACAFSPFCRGNNPDLYYPTPIHDTLSNLRRIASNSIYSSVNLYVLHIKTLHHRALLKPAVKSEPSVAPENSYVILSASSGSINVKTMATTREEKMKILDKNIRIHFEEKKRQRCYPEQDEEGEDEEDSDDKDSDDYSSDYSSDSTSEYRDSQNAGSIMDISPDLQVPVSLAVDSLPPINALASENGFQFGPPSSLFGSTRSISNLPAENSDASSSSISIPAKKNMDLSTSKLMAKSSWIGGSADMLESSAKKPLKGKGSEIRQSQPAFRARVGPLERSSWIGSSAGGTSDVAQQRQKRKDDLAMDIDDPHDERSVARTSMSTTRRTDLNSMHVGTHPRKKSIKQSSWAAGSDTKRQGNTSAGMASLAEPGPSNSHIQPQNSDDPRHRTPRHLTHAPDLALPPSLASVFPGSERLNAAKTFYRNHNPSKPVERSFHSPYSQEANKYYNADLYRELKPPSTYDRQQDEMLMLFRDPPPWTDLELALDRVFAAQTAVKKPTISSPEKAVIVDRSTMKGILSDSLIKRRKVEVEETGGKQLPHTVQPLGSSKNPFRRRQSAPKSIGVVPSLLAPTSTNIMTPSSVGKRGAPPTGKATLKPLKPISSVKVPLLSKQEHLEALAREREEEKAASGPVKSRVKTNGRASPSISTRREMPQSSLWTGEKQTGRKGGGVDGGMSKATVMTRRGIRVSNPVPKAKGIGEGEKVGYDWGSWSRTSRR